MMRSLFSGVAGLKTHQIKMDVIGNNIANVNTVAFKSQSITFTELMYQTTQRASGPSDTTGMAGRNAKQIGLGVTTGAINTQITTTGATQNTGNAFDVRITGESFFVVSNGNGYNFTRDGSFYVDAAGTLAMSSTGYNVMGWLPDENGNIVQDTVKKLQILSAENMISEPQATTKGTISGILDRNDSNVLSSAGKVMNFSFYDNMGYSYTARFNIKATDEDGVYILSLSDILSGKNSILDKFGASIFVGDDASGSTIYAAKSNSYGTMEGFTLVTTGNDADGNPVYSGAITITDDIKEKYGLDVNTLSPGSFLDADGNVKNDDTSKKQAAAYAAAFGFSSFDELAKQTTSSTDADGNIVWTPISKTLASATAGTLFSDGTLNVDGYSMPAGTSVKVVYDQERGTLVGLNGSDMFKSFNMQITPLEEGADNPFEIIELDMSASKNINNEKTSTIGANYGDSQGNGAGWPVGEMIGVSIQYDGKIYGAYGNGQTKLLGQIAVANFANAAGLEKVGDNLYAATLNSGEFDGIGVDVTSDGGSINSGVLEMSNVDLSTEFTELITTQRGFQANSRIITVSDTLLEELVNLKR